MSRVMNRQSAPRGRRPGAASDVDARKKKFDEYQKDVKRKAYGNWDSILAALAPALAPALGAGPTSHVFCPVHEGKNGDAFRVLNDFRLTGGTVCNTCGMRSDGFATLMWLYGWDFIRTVKEVGESLGLKYGNGFSPSIQAASVQVVEVKQKEEDPEAVRRRDERRAAQMVELWSSSYSLFDPEAAIAREYLKSRGINRVYGPLADLRFHPAVSYWENNVDLGEFPAMLRMLRQPDGRTLTIERLYLTPEGRKAQVEKQKKIMPLRSCDSYHGSAVRLDHDVGLVLCVAEGVETALSYRAMMGFPTWATTVAGLMEALVIPAHVELVLIAADLDPPVQDASGNTVPGRGAVAAEILAERIRSAGRKAAIVMPPFQVPAGRDKLDWNDVLVELGIDAAREQPFVQKARARVAAELQAMGYADWREASHVHY